MTGPIERIKAMKQIEATIQHYKLDPVKQALFAVGVKGMTIMEVHSIDGETRTMTYRGVTKLIDTIPKFHIRAIVSDENVDAAIGAVLVGAHTGNEGDGMIVISDVNSVTRIRTQETETSDSEFAHDEEATQQATAGSSRWDVPSYQHRW
jgi:nitrogen regulatory protein P-II 2